MGKWHPKAAAKQKAKPQTEILHGCLWEDQLCALEHTVLCKSKRRWGHASNPDKN